MLTTGNQLRAARSLVDMDQSTLADRAGLNINTIGSMEKRGSEMLTSGLDKIRAVMTVLEAEGVEFLNHGQPGVRLKVLTRADLTKRIDAINAHLQTLPADEAPSPAAGMRMLERGHKTEVVKKLKQKRAKLDTSDS